MELRPQVPEFEGNAQSNIVQYWGFFSKEEITREAGRLLMLDIDFGRDCSLRCPTCFRQTNPVDDSHDEDLTFEELLDVIRDARQLGLKEVKICGAGEPFENPNLLRLAHQLTNWNIGLAIFTKGHVLGDDGLAAKYFAKEGITDARSLISKLFRFKTSILVSFQSFKSNIQDTVVGNVLGHTLRRNRAVELLAKAGFNKCSPTRLALCTNPITKNNFDELFEIYVWCCKRNILPVVTTLMVSGKQFNRRFLNRIDVTDLEKLELYTHIYAYNIRHGVQTLDQIEREGISSMAGIHPCNQVAAGLYITCNGNVVPCPGDCVNILGNVRKNSIVEIWHNSPNYRLRGTFNCHCPPKAGKSLPRNLYTAVLRRLMAKFRDRIPHISQAELCQVGG